MRSESDSAYIVPQVHANDAVRALKAVCSGSLGLSNNADICIATGSASKEFAATNFEFEFTDLLEAIRGFG